MNNIQCAGNYFTKPLICWSLLDWLVVVGIMFVIGVVFISATGKRY